MTTFPPRLTEHTTSSRRLQNNSTLKIYSPSINTHLAADKCHDRNSFTAMSMITPHSAFSIRYLPTIAHDMILTRSIFTHSRPRPPYRRVASSPMQPFKTYTTATSKDRLIPLAVLTVLTLATLLALVYYPKYRVAGDELLQNPMFTESLAGWEQSGRHSAFSQSEGVARLSQQSDKDSSRLTQNIKGNELSGVYLISTRLGGNNIVAGSEDWQNGALVLIRSDENNTRIGSEEIVGLQGTRGISDYQKFIEVPSPTANITLTARMLNATGELLIESISLKHATKQTIYPTLKTIIIASWIGISILLFVLHLRKFGVTLPFAALCSIAALAFIGTLMPKQFSVDLTAAIANLMPEQFNAGIKQTVDFFFPGYIGHAHQEISKFGHWLAFLSLTIASAVLLRKTPIHFIVISVLLVAATTETLQFLTSARTPHVYDFIIDAAGALIGLIVALPIRWGIQKRSA